MDEENFTTENWSDDEQQSYENILGMGEEDHYEAFTDMCETKLSFLTDFLKRSKVPENKIEEITPLCKQIMQILRHEEWD